MDVFELSGPIRALLAIAIAAVPAIVTLIRGRRIARFADDPALPERLFASRRKASSVVVFTVAALLIFTGAAATWAIPLTVIAYFAAGFPLRRTLYNETWTLAVYLSFMLRLFVSAWSFWLLVCGLPALALSAGERAWVIALGAGGALMLLASRQTEFMRWLMGAKAVPEPLRARFDRLLAATALAAPHFEFVDLKGGAVANAVALPSLHRSAVVFTGPLLQRLDPDETDAICAHELAHLEYYNTRRMRQRRVISRLLVAAGAVLAPLMLAAAPSIAWFACAVWPIVVLMAIAALARDRQKHETASDLRAVAMTGNPEALVRALVKIHAMARVPRRWDAELERHMTHPSLKRRIQDIRAAAGTPPAALGHTAAFDSADGTARVVLGDESLEWVEGSSASYRVRYDRLSDLRIAATRTGETILLAADRAGHRWQMPVRGDDVPRIQAVLDIVDVRVEIRPQASTAQPVMVRAAALVVCVVSLNAGMIAVAMVLALTLVRPEGPLLGASGLAAIGGALLVWRDSGGVFGFVPGEFQFAFGAVLFAAAAILLWLAYGRRRDAISMRAWKFVGLIAIAAFVSWLAPMWGGGLDAVGLHQAVRQWPSTVVFPLALAGATMWSSRKALRVASVVAVTTSVIAAAAGSDAFLDRFGRDPFLLPTPTFNVRTLDRPIKEFTVPFAATQLQLSPSGESIALISRGRGGHATIHIGHAGDTLTAIDGDGALFVDDDRALVWVVDGTRTDLRQVRVSAPETAGWQVRVTGISNPLIWLDAKSGRWRLTSPGVNELEAREGRVGTSAIDSYHWPMPSDHGVPLLPIAASSDRVLAVEPRLDLSSPPADPLGALVFVLASAPRWRSTIWALGPDEPKDLGTSRFELECHRLPLAERGACQIFDASRTRFFTMDADTRQIAPVASLPGRFLTSEEPQNSWLVGWYQSSPLALRFAPADAVRVAGPHGEHAHMLAASDHVVAGVWHQMPAVSGLRVDSVEQQTTAVIRIYRID